MLKPTRLGRFGHTYVHLVLADESGAFSRIQSAVEGAEGASDLGSDAGAEYGDVSVGLVISALVDSGDDDGEMDDADGLFVGLFISDRDEEDSSPSYPGDGPIGGTVREVGFSDLMNAVSHELAGRHFWQFRSYLGVDAETVDSAFPLPVSFWHSNMPLGQLIGARFELDVRGVRDGSLTIDSDDDELVVVMRFAKNVRVDADLIERAWEPVRRIYDKILIAKMKERSAET